MKSTVAQPTPSKPFSVRLLLAEFSGRIAAEKEEFGGIDHRLIIVNPMIDYEDHRVGFPDSFQHIPDATHVPCLFFMMKVKDVWVVICDACALLPEQAITSIAAPASIVDIRLRRRLQNRRPRAFESLAPIIHGIQHAADHAVPHVRVFFPKPAQ